MLEDSNMLQSLEGDALYQVAGIALLTLIAHLVLIHIGSRLFMIRRKRAREQEAASMALKRHRDQLVDRNRSYEESLSYAQRIQKAISLSPRELSSFFPDSFIYQKAKDIVSGDFNWARKIGDKVLFAVADCTGHGVPGAFMSLIGLEFFRQITHGMGVHDPGSILNRMNRLFDLVFEDSDDLTLKDGMDLSLCAFDRRTWELEFAGAFSSVYLVRDQEITVLRGAKNFVGPDNGLPREGFTTQKIKLEKNDILYLFTDGFPDQFGGPEGKKFKYRRFRHLLLNIHNLPMEVQKRELESQMKEWMGDQEQIDDQTIIGLRPASFASSGSKRQR